MMLKLTLKPGDFINIGEEIKVVFSGGSANNIHLLIDAPRELNIKRNKAVKNISSESGKKQPAGYYAESGISKEAQQKIVQILMQEKKKNQTS